MRDTAFLARLVRRAGRVPTHGLSQLLAAPRRDEARMVGMEAGTTIKQMGVEDRAAVLETIGRLTALGPIGPRKPGGEPRSRRL